MTRNRRVFAASTAAARHRSGSRPNPQTRWGDTRGDRTPRSRNRKRAGNSIHVCPTLVPDGAKFVPASPVHATSTRVRSVLVPLRARRRPQGPHGQGSSRVQVATGSTNGPANRGGSVAWSSRNTVGRKRHDVYRLRSNIVARRSPVVKTPVSDDRSALRGEP